MTHEAHRFRTHLSSLVVLIAVLSTLFVACGLPGNNSATAGNSGVITAGVLAPLTGQGAASGQDMANGWKLYWAQNGDKVCGGKYTVKSLIQDTAGSPDTGISKARAMVEQNGAQFVVGPLFANVGYAVAQYAESKQIPMFSPIASSDDLTQRQKNDYFIRVAGWTSSQTTHPFADWILKNYPQYKNIVTIGSDYAFGYETIGGFVDRFTTGGGHVLKELWAPLSTTDFSPYFSQINSLHPDAVFVEEVGADAPRFIQQWASSGMKAKYPLISNETTVDQSLLRKMKPQDAEGIISARHFAEGRNDPATQQFDQLWQQKYGVYPSYYAAAMYTAAQWLAKSFNTVNCKISGSDQSHWLDTVRSTTLPDSPFGPEHLDNYNNPVFNVYIAKVEIQSNGTAWNVPIDTIPNVSQFWTVPPDQYLQQKPYSKTFQGNNYHP